MPAPTDFASRLTDFLSVHLPGHKRLSPHTIASYRDAFVLLLGYRDAEHGIPAEKLALDDLTPEHVTGWLDWLQASRGSSPATRNTRLCAMKSFFRYLQYKDPARLHHWQRVLAIPMQKTPQATVGYLTLDGIRLLLAQPDTTTQRGRRDLALLSFMYDSAARVQEVIDLTPGKLRLDHPCTVELFGKGSKSRIVPLLDAQTTILSAYLHENGLDRPARSADPVFANRDGRRLTRAGVAYILTKHATTARTENPALIPEKTHCHSLRHSKAMHLLQAGVNLVYIRDILGHTSITTTEIYARADSLHKRQALERAYTPTTTATIPAWLTDTSLLTWLNHFNE